MTYPELLNEQVKLAVKAKLTAEDVDRLGEIHKTLELYFEHPLGELMRGWHDLACEMDSHAARLEHDGRNAMVERSKARIYHTKAEDVRLRIDMEELEGRVEALEEKGC